MKTFIRHYEKMKKKNEKHNTSIANMKIKLAYGNTYNTYRVETFSKLTQ